MAILGLMSTEQFASERFTSIRRSVFYQYPGGAAPLMGLLSMLDGEVLNDPEFSWYEDRYVEKVQTLVNNGTTSGPWYADSTGSLGSAMGTSAAARTVDVAYWLKMDGVDNIRPNDVLNLTVPITGGKATLQVRVAPNAAGVWESSNTVRVIAIQTVAAVLNDDTDYPAGQLREVQVLGNANTQGQTGSVEGSFTVPMRTGNTTQIFRTPYSFTGTALVTAAKFDESGPYVDKAKKVALSHMIDMEKMFLFGNPSKSVDPTTNLPRYTTGGVLFFLRLWEVGQGNTYSGVTANYGVSASTSNADDNKRIIDFTSVSVTDEMLSDYYERLFRKSSEVSNEKFAFVGSGFLNMVNKLYKSNVQFTADVPHSDSYGLNVVKHVTPFGTVYYKTHPLFSQNAFMRYNALFIDAQQMRYRYVQGRDTEIRKNTQPNDADYRKDEYFTEAGMELQFPEGFMYMQNLTSVA